MNGPPLDDPLPDLMIRYQGGDEAAFDAIYRLTVAGLERYLGRWAGAAARDDLVQETYLQVHRARRTYRPGLPFRPWLYAIARHVALWSQRTRRRRWSREIGVAEYPERATPEPQPDALLRRRLEEAIARLPPGQQEVVWLAQVEGLTSAEIARVTGATAGAIKVRLHRANLKLRAWLESIAPGADLEEERID